MLASMTFDQLLDWMAFVDVDGPFGERRADLRSATICATVAGVNRVKGPAPKIDDFMPKFGAEVKARKPLTDGEQFKKFTTMLDRTYRRGDNDPDAAPARRPTKRTFPVRLPPGAVGPNQQ